MGYAWPLDRRILYNRASARPTATVSERKALIWWDEKKRDWTGHDVADFTRGKRPDYSRMRTAAEMKRSRRRAVHHASRRHGMDLGSLRA